MRKAKEVFLGIARRRGTRGGYRYYNLEIPLNAANFNKLSRLKQLYIRDILDEFYKEKRNRWVPIFISHKTNKFLMEKPKPNTLVRIGLHDTVRNWAVELPTVDGSQQEPQKFSSKLEQDWIRWLSDAQKDKVLWYELGDIPFKRFVSPGVKSGIRACPVLGEWDASGNFIYQKKGGFFVNHMVEILQQKATLNVVHPFKPRRFVIKTDSKKPTIAKALQNVVFNVPYNLPVWATITATINTHAGKVTVGPLGVSALGEDLKWKISHTLCRAFWNRGASFTKPADLLEFGDDHENPDYETWHQIEDDYVSVDGELIMKIELTDGL